MKDSDKHHIIGKYLQTIGVVTEEFFNEMEDHILDSYENRHDRNQSLQHHIRDIVQPSFGGVSRIVKIERSQIKRRRKMIWSKFLQIYAKQLIGWPNVLITSLVILIVYWTNLHYDGSNLFFMTCALTVFTILFFLTKLLLQQYHNKKKNNYYKNSQVYQIIGTEAHFLFLIPQSAIQMFLISGNEETLNAILNSPYFIIPSTIFLLLYFISAIQLYKEEFRIEISN